VKTNVMVKKNRTLAVDSLSDGQEMKFEVHYRDHKSSQLAVMHPVHTLQPFFLQDVFYYYPSIYTCFVQLMLFSFPLFDLRIVPIIHLPGDCNIFVLFTKYRCCNLINLS
jgi:hypothetical protein